MFWTPGKFSLAMEFSSFEVSYIGPALHKNKPNSYLTL
jgi:hypothetical protein